MTLQQLRYLVAVADNALNITAAAESLHTVQPAVSKQLSLLEAELGFNVFERRGRALVAITPPGQRVLGRARLVLGEATQIRNLAKGVRAEEAGTLSIATTHTHARYVLPKVLPQFRRFAPKVQVQLHQGDADQITSMLARDRIDLAIGAGDEERVPGMVRVPCEPWPYVIAAPRAHPLVAIARPTLAHLAKYPLLAHAFSTRNSSDLTMHFSAVGLNPDVVLTTWDADVLKTYLRWGLGVGVMAGLAADPEADHDLAFIDASHLFPSRPTWIGFRRGLLLRRYVVHFIGLLVPQFSWRAARAAEADTSAGRKRRAES